MQRPQEGASGGEAKDTCGEGTGQRKGVSEAARVLIPKAFVGFDLGYDQVTGCAFV